MDPPPVDERVKVILERLDQSSGTHPNVCIVWRNYLLQKINRLEADLFNCEHLLNNLITEMPDINLTTLLLIGHIPLTLNTGDNE